MRACVWLVTCLLLAGCSVSLGAGVETSASKGWSRSWGSGGGPSWEVVDDLDDLEHYCRDRAERRLARDGGSFRWRSRRSGRGDRLEFSGTVEGGKGALQVSCRARRGQPLHEVHVELQPLQR